MAPGLSTDQLGNGALRDAVPTRELEIAGCPIGMGSADFSHQCFSQPSIRPLRPAPEAIWMKPSPIRVTASHAFRHAARPVGIAAWQSSRNTCALLGTTGISAFLHHIRDVSRLDGQDQVTISGPGNSVNRVGSKISIIPNASPHIASVGDNFMWLRPMTAHREPGNVRDRPPRAMDRHLPIAFPGRPVPEPARRGDSPAHRQPISQGCRMEAHREPTPLGVMPRTVYGGAWALLSADSTISPVPAPKGAHDATDKHR